MDADSGNRFDSSFERKIKNKTKTTTATESQVVGGLTRAAKLTAKLHFSKWSQLWHATHNSHLLAHVEQVVFSLGCYCLICLLLFFLKNRITAANDSLSCRFLLIIKCLSSFAFTARWCAWWFVFFSEANLSFPPLLSLLLASLCCHGYGRRLPSEEDGSMSSNGSGKLNTSKSSSARRTATGGSSKNGKEELHKRSANGEEEEKV